MASLDFEHVVGHQKHLVVHLFSWGYNLVATSATNYSQCQFTPVRLGGSLGALSCGPMLLLWQYYY